MVVAWHLILVAGLLADGVSMEFVANGATARLGGYRPLRAEMDGTAEAVKVAPEGVTAPKYGTLTIGDKSWLFILDEPEGQPSRLFVDTNADGDFSNDAATVWNAAAQGNLTMYRGEAQVDLGDNKVGTLGVYRFDPNDQRRAQFKNSLFYYTDFGYDVKMELDGTSVSTFVAGLPTPDSALWIDRDGNGRRSAKREMVAVGKPFNFTGTTYVLNLADNRLTLDTAAEPLPMTPLPPDLNLGKSALDFTATALAGHSIEFPKSYAGRLVMLDFWATWCGPCIAELPNLRKAYEDWHHLGFEVLGISFDDTEMAEKLATFTAQNNMPWPQIYEGKGWNTTLGELYDVSGIPFVLLVDGDSGEILGTSTELRGPGLSDFIGAALQKKVASTEHFWYRRQPPGPYVDSQRDHKAFGFTDDAVLLSEDNGRTWPHRLAFPDARNITFSCILGNGNILFATAAQLYLSTDSLQTCQPITVKDASGQDYLPHTPQNAEQPGWYFHPLSGVHTWDVNGQEVLVWGNYCNVMGGASPVNIYYSADGGQTVKIAYAFGQNPHFRDDGSAGGGATGTLLGDSGNPVICRHIHCVAYNPAENAFYACTGDADQPEGHECHWLRGTYDAAQDAWQWSVIVSESLNTRYKCGGLNFVDGMVYWISDANGPEPHDRGVFRCRPEDIPHRDKHEMLFNPQYECANMIIQDGVILAGHYTPASPYTLGIIFSPDMGKTWTQYDLKDVGYFSPVRFQRKNSDGWFRVDLRKGWIERGDVLFIQPKTPPPPEAAEPAENP